MFDGKRIVLPTLNWFKFGNIYTGSLAPDHTKGCLSQTVFNYRVKAENNLLYAICYFTLPWNTASNMDEAVLGRFDATEFGLEIAENWITSKVFIQQLIVEKIENYKKGENYEERYINCTQHTSKFSSIIYDAV